MVGNTDLGTLVRIPIRPNGAAGEASGDRGRPGDLRTDGLTVDAKGTVYACVIVQSTIVRIGEGGIETLATAADGLNNASSIAFGQGLASQEPVRRELLGLLPAPTPSLFRLRVGVPGAHQP